MAKSLFNEAEVYLMENWTDARLLERSLAKMREEYAEVLQRALNEVKKRHPEFDCHGIEPRELDEDQDDDCDCIILGVGKKSWPSLSRRNWFTGFWICGITFGELVAHGEGFPSACIFINPTEDSNMDLDDVAMRLEEAANHLFPDKIVTHTVDNEDGWASVEYPLPESRKTLLELLLKDNSQGFIKCLGAQFETLAKLAPGIDEILLPKKRTRKLT